MLRLWHHLPKPILIPHSRFNLQPFNHQPKLLSSKTTPPHTVTNCPRLLIPWSVSENDVRSSHTAVRTGNNEFITDSNTEETKQGAQKNFWGAVSLIIGTAVGPGMLGLPAATIKSGSFPSTIAILLCWVYVISSIVLVAELSYAAMQEDGIAEVSYTGLAIKAFGSHFGALVAVVYASLSFSLLVACVSGIGSIVCQWLPWMNPLLSYALFPVVVGIIIGFFPFKAIDTANRLLCLLMVLSISALVGIGLSVARTSVLGSFARISWSISTILPAIPVTVLTLGFHVITPFICKIAGNDVSEARKAILIGGIVPLVMVLSWNLIVLGLAGANPPASTDDPISLLLSVNPSALSAVQGFAFSALATSLIGYAVSFPKQLLDTLELIFTKERLEKKKRSRAPTFSSGDGAGRVGYVTFFLRTALASAGRVVFDGSNFYVKKFIMLFVLGIPVIVGSYFPSTFSKALDFAGVYANCFLFGILPPAMTYIQQSKNKLRSCVLPAGDLTLLLLFVIAIILGIWH
ncbi:hypothetical protein K2173_026876 [Erythroxylum novogranatense]|uniref:Tyrosine-specific transport protein n=1 Tax=Erythroxylum novogranatense TaxID=1862640 RepID=A0AAV8U0D3_9ROSI|nr:hypothetical protein K2173_026876 [Erythroxylum novogranatense]